MKKIIYFFSALLIMGIFLINCQDSITPTESQDSQITSLAKKGDNECTKIQDGILLTSGGDLITTGFMENGYNYQAHLFNMEYDDGWKLVMKWNDAWLSNKDCDGDGKLDRPLDENGAQYYFGSGAWCTNHWTTTYLDANGNKCNFVEFIKIIALPDEADVYLKDGFWYYNDGREIGESIWGQFAIIQYVVNDPCEGIGGVQYKSPVRAGLGGW